MKNKILIILLLALSYNSNAQTESTISSAGGVMVDMNLFQNPSATEINDAVASEYEGTPYLNNEFIKGTISLNNVVQEFFIRYNVLKKRFEFSNLSNKEDVKKIPEIDNLIITLEGKNFKYLKLSNLDPDYYEIIKKFDENVYLIKNYSKRIYSGGQKTSYNSNNKSKIKSYSTLYYVNNSNINKISNHKKKVLKAFPESQKSELKDFIKQNRIKFDDDYLGIISVIEKNLTIK